MFYIKSKRMFFSLSPLNRSYLTRPLWSVIGTQTLASGVTTGWTQEVTGCLSFIQHNSSISSTNFHISFTANATAMYYGYYTLPDGTVCLAPPPPGIDATSYYNNMPSGVMASPASSGTGPNVGSTPTPAETTTVTLPATAPSTAPAVKPETR